MLAVARVKICRMRLRVVTAVAAAGCLSLGFLDPIQATAEAQQGSLEGHVVLSSRIASRRPRFRLYSEYGQPAVPPATRADTNEMSNVVIYMESAAGTEAVVPQSGPLRIEQSNEAFVPHILAVTIGSTVDFPNKDPFFHNVFSLSRAKTFDLGRFPEGSSKSVMFDHVGIVQVFCHIHSDMSAVVMVLPSGRFTSPGAGGEYSILHLPAGTYRVTAWHERAKSIAATVRIEEGKTAHIDFNIPISDVEPQQH